MSGTSRTSPLLVRGPRKSYGGIWGLGFANVDARRKHLLSLGLLISARPRRVEVVSGLINVVMLPMWISSGVFFSSARFPDAVQPLIRAILDRRDRRLAGVLP